MFQVTLIPVDGLDANDSFLLDEFPVTIGRGLGAHVRLHDRFVSRNHCELYELEGKPVVRDLGSKNGTFVNGYSVDQTLMMPEDLLRVGMTRFLVAYNAPASAGPDAPGALVLMGEEAA